MTISNALIRAAASLTARHGLNIARHKEEV